MELNRNQEERVAEWKVQIVKNEQFTTDMKHS